MSTKKTRRKFSNEFKTKVCIEALKERQTLAELSAKYEIHQGVISNWKTEFLENSTKIFESKEDKSSAENKTDDLYKRIGELEMENQFLKKNLKKFGL